MAADSQDLHRIDIAAVRDQFPLLQRLVHGGKPLIYLDAAATTPKPNAVLDAVMTYDTIGTANVHRAAHVLSVEATEAFESARRRIATFINAASSDEVIFTRGTTESINLVANVLAHHTLGAGDTVLITEMEHHANIVPWQLIRDRLDITLQVIPMDAEGQLDLEAFASLLEAQPKVVAATWVSNALGTVNPIHDLVRQARSAGAITLVDAAQALPHRPVDVQSLGADFIAFSGHKMYGPTGIGCLWGRESLLDELPPWQGGGDMIETVTFAKTTFNRLPWKFEAGTPAIAGAIGLGAAVDWLGSLGMPAVEARETALIQTLARTLEDIDRVTLVGHPEERASAVSFLVEGLHPHDVGAMLDQHGVAIRTGHHCAQPTMQHFGVSATARASLGIYNDESDIAAFDTALRRVIEVFG